MVKRKPGAYGAPPFHHSNFCKESESVAEAQVPGGVEVGMHPQHQLQSSRIEVLHRILLQSSVNICEFL